jgi:Skp family chaperone for outer membrane proteins
MPTGLARAESLNRRAGPQIQDLRTMAAATRQLTPAEQAELSQMFFDLTHDKETRRDIARLVKKKFPDRAAAFGDVDLSDQIEALRQEQEQKELMAQARVYQAELDRQAAELSSKYSPEQIAAIREVADRAGNTIDLKTAAVLYAHENPPPNPQEGPPEEPKTGTWEFPTVNGRDGKAIPFADFAKDPNSAARNAAYQVITDFKKRSGMPAALR